MGTLLVLGAVYLVATRFEPDAVCTATPLREPPPVDAATLKARARVLLITLDGVQWREALDPDGPLKQTLAAARAVLPGKTSGVIPLSLPGYQAIALGHATGCATNQCPRVAEETLSEGLARELALPVDQVATVGSWARLARAASSKDGAVRVDVPDEGPHPNVPWPNARLDADTAERAFALWRTQRPRFLHLALLDMDEWAHANDPAAATRALREADATISRFLAAIPADDLPFTTVLVTTDHGRGWGPLAFDHGPFDAARSIFLLAIGARVRGGEGAFTQVQIRPTVERLFGLCPSTAAIDAVALCAR